MINRPNRAKANNQALWSVFSPGKGKLPFPEFLTQVKDDLIKERYCYEKAKKPSCGGD
jgi:hypothetical protein